MSAPAFELGGETDAASGLVRFRLRDADLRRRGAHQVRIEASSGALWEGLFDTRAHVDRYQRRPGFSEHASTPEELLERLGVFLGEEVLGGEIAGRLAEGVHDRTLLVRLPEITGREERADDDRLAAALALVPWEIARPAAGGKPLMERNVVVRVVTPDVEAGAWTARPPPAEEPLRVLLVFAEAPGSRPLAMRLERETLLELFYEEVMPRHRVRLDVLCHGVTRERLRAQVEDAGGYHRWATPTPATLRGASTGASWRKKSQRRPPRPWRWPAASCCGRAPPSTAPWTTRPPSSSAATWRPWRRHGGAAPSSASAAPSRSRSCPAAAPSWTARPRSSAAAPP